MNKKIIISTLFFSLCLSILISIFVFGFHPTWKFLGVPTIDPVYHDFRIVSGALISHIQGFDPQISNPGDPAKRLFNYPLTWLFFAEVFELNEEKKFLLVGNIIVLFFVFINLSILLKKPSYITLLFLFSNSTLLAVERGNTDLIIFILIFFVVKSPKFFKYLLSLIAVALKVFPIFSFLYFFKNYKNSEKKYILAFIFLVLILLVFLWPQLKHLVKNTPVDAFLSYGTKSLSFAFQKIGIGISYVYFLLLFIILIFIGFIISLKLNYLYFKVHKKKSYFEDLFLMGGGIYVGTFLFSSNFDYRLIFLLFCLPYLYLINNQFFKATILASIFISMNFLPLSFIFNRDVAFIINFVPKCYLVVAIGSILLFILDTKFNNSLKNLTLKIEKKIFKKNIKIPKLT